MSRPPLFAKKKIENGLTRALSQNPNLPTEQVLNHFDYPHTILAECPEIIDYFMHESRISMLFKLATEPALDHNFILSHHATKFFSAPGNTIHMRLSKSEKFISMFQNIDFHTDSAKAIANYSLILQAYIIKENNSNIITDEMFHLWLSHADIAAFSLMIKLYFQFSAMSSDAKLTDRIHESLRTVTYILEKDELGSYQLLSVLKSIISDFPAIAPIFIEPRNIPFIHEIIAIIIRKQTAPCLCAVRFIKTLANNPSGKSIIADFMKTREEDKSVTDFLLPDSEQFTAVKAAFLPCLFPSKFEVLDQFAEYFFVDHSVTLAWLDSAIAKKGYPIRGIKDAHFLSNMLKQVTLFQQEWYTQFKLLTYEQKVILFDNLHSRHTDRDVPPKAIDYTIYDVLPTTLTNAKTETYKKELVEGPATNPWISELFDYARNPKHTHEFKEERLKLNPKSPYIIANQVEESLLVYFDNSPVPRKFFNASASYYSKLDEIRDTYKSIGSQSTH